MDDPTKDKSVDQLITEMLAYRGGTTSDTFQRPYMARIHAIVAKEQSAAAVILERQTNKLIVLTRVLVALTVALFLLTAFLCYDAYQHRESIKLADHSSTK